MKQQIIREELKECSRIMEDLFGSGLAVVQKPILARLQSMSTTVRQYGLETLAGWLAELGERLEQRRHETEHGQDEELWLLFTQINRYLKLAIRQADFDEAGERMRGQD